jgi:hypothetical protein
MNNYVIKKGSLYVAKPGSNKSYTAILQNAQTFRHREVAENNACGNEHVESVDDQF